MPIYTSDPAHRQVHILLPALLSKKPSKIVENFTEIKADAYEMLDTLDKGIVRNGIRAGAVALSHCQISVQSFKFFVLDRRFKDLFGKRRIIVNAKIVDQKDMVPFREGCLSFPDRPEAQTRRFRHIEVEYQVPDASGELGRPKRYKFSDFPAMILQHEIDHSEGLNIYEKFEQYNLPEAK